MSEYEITYLSNPQLSEEERAQLDASVDTQVAELGGSISYHSPHIRRRLAYPVVKAPGVFLRMLQIELGSDQIEPLRRWLNKQTAVVRSSILQTARRPEVPSSLFQVGGKDTKKAPVPARAVSMEEVEKGIEEALAEEVK